MSICSTSSPGARRNLRADRPRPSSARFSYRLAAAVRVEDGATVRPASRGPEDGPAACGAAAVGCRRAGRCREARPSRRVAGVLVRPARPQRLKANTRRGRGELLAALAVTPRPLRPTNCSCCPTRPLAGRSWTAGRCVASSRCGPGRGGIISRPLSGYRPRADPGALRRARGGLAAANPGGFNWSYWTRPTRAATWTAALDISPLTSRPYGRTWRRRCRRCRAYRRFALGWRLLCSPPELLSFAIICRAARLAGDPCESGVPVHDTGGPVRPLPSFRDR